MTLTQILEARQAADYQAGDYIQLEDGRAIAHQPQINQDGTITYIATEIGTGRKITWTK